MQVVSKYQSPLGELLLAADEIGLTGAWFAGQKFCPQDLSEWEEGETPLLQAAKGWLDVYFSGQEPSFSVPLHLAGTPFQLSVWNALGEIPYGSVTTYGQLAKSLGCRSAQAVGGAVGRNPVSVFVPCHRVLGAGGDLTGYAGGLARKKFLLELEK